MRKIRIVSNGRVHGTRVIDVETGEAIDGIARVEWLIDTRTQRAARIILELAPTVPVELEGLAEVAPSEGAAEVTAEVTAEGDLR